VNPTKRDAWKREALDMVFSALAENEELSSYLVYKGARVLALRLGKMHRASLDLDANLMLKFSKQYPDRDAQSGKLKSLITDAVVNHTNSQSPVRFELEDIRLMFRPRDSHPMGWNAFDVEIKLRDFANQESRGLPRVTFDIAAPETLGENAISPLAVGDQEVFAYTLERIAGEKLRAFLSSLPAYRAKVKKPGEAVRVKDIYDLAHIVSVHPTTDVAFWKMAGNEFRLACDSRYIDCKGRETFEQNIAVTASTYKDDPTIPKDIPFDSAWVSIEKVIERWSEFGILPFSNPLPD
jgi:sulfur relay (sulfurtransferase) DsrF/TusC family protein